MAATVNASLFARLEDLVSGRPPSSTVLAPRAPRVASEQLHARWHQAIRDSGRASLPIELAARSHLHDWDIFGFVIMTAPTLREALTVAATYFPLINSTGTWELSSAFSVTRLRWRHPQSDTVGTRASVESVLSHFVAGVTELAGKPLVCAASLAHPPTQTRAALEALCGCSVSFESGSGANFLEFPTAALSRSVSSANEPIHHYFRHRCDEALAAIADDETQFVISVRRLMLQRLPEAKVNATGIARELGLSRRSLHRRLAERRTSFRSELREARKQRAQELVSARGTALGEIGFELGFADASSFSRWFRACFGTSPRAARKAALIRP